MGILQKLLKRGTTGREIDSEIETMRELFSQKQDAEAECLGKQLLRRDLSPEQREAVLRTVGLSLFQQEKFPEALSYLEPLSAHSADPGAHFNVASCAIMAGNIERGLEALNTALQLYPKHGDETIPPPQYQRFYIMQALISRNAYPQAFTLLQAQFTVFAKLGITDMTFLAIRGIPSLQATLNKAEPLFADLDAAIALMELRKEVDDEGRSVIDRFVARLRETSVWPLHD